LNSNHRKTITRRRLIHYSLSTGALLGVSSIFPSLLMAGSQAAAIEHPIHHPQKYTDKGRCPNCGMMLNMWARTRHEFSNSEGSHTTCSIRCLADMSKNSGETPNNIKVALYLHPEKMVAADKAFYVIGSSAKGTMTMKSKVAFLTEEEAKNFVSEYGGTLVDYTTALTAATKELAASRMKIEGKRKKKGEIVEPTSENRCLVCGMYPARFPKHRAQVSMADGSHQHFCSNQCLVHFMADQKKYLKIPEKVKSIWVTVYPDGGYEYAMGLYYLVGSNIMGPMGKEALPYRLKSDADSAAEEHGGSVIHFRALNPSKVMTP